MNDEMTSAPARNVLRSYLSVLRRQWWVPLVVVVIAMAAAFAYLRTATPTYSASMKIVVGQGRSFFGADASGAFQPFTQTMIDLLNSDVVAQRTIRERGLDLSSRELLDDLTATTNPDTSVLQVTYVATDRAEAVATLRTIGDIFVSLIDQNLADLGTQTTTTPVPGATTPVPATTSSDAVSATVFDPAHANPGQESPRTRRTLALALLLSLVGGVLLAFLRDSLSNSLRTDDEVADAFGGRVLALLPEGLLGTRPNDVTFMPQKMADRITESVLLLAAALRFAPDARQGGVVVVTSPNPGDGKSSVAAHLSTALADSGAWVVAVEGDLHRPQLHRLLGVEPERPGLSDVLLDKMTAEEAITIVPRPLKRVAREAAEAEAATPVATSEKLSKLELLSAGHRYHNSAQLLSMGSMAALLTQLRDLVEWVVIDTPPVLLSGDTYPMLRMADHVIVVTREGQTTRDEAEAFRRRMADLGVERYSIVITDSSEATHRTYGYQATT